MPTNDRPFGLPVGGILSNSADIQYFTTAGTFVWQRPPVEKYTMVRIYCFGAGGAGGAGGGGAASGGGGGGGGGAIAIGEYPLRMFNAAEWVTVGLGGAGGASVAAGTGNSGSVSGPSLFKFGGTSTSPTLIHAAAGGQGTGGGVTGGGGGGGASMSAAWGYLVQHGGPAGDGKTDPTAGVAGNNIPDDAGSVTFRLASAGGGGGAGSGGIAAGGNGGACYQLTGGVATGDRRGTSYRFDDVTLSDPTWIPVPEPLPYPASGGAGGSDVSAGAGGPNGGHGGEPGGGGGGGAGHSGASGAGGAGGHGAVWVICY